jgi:hypothetical protein
VGLVLYRCKDERRNPGVSATMDPIVTLLDHEQFDNKGHLLCLDNWYTSLDAALRVKENRGMDMVGTIRINKMGKPKKGVIPKSGKGKKARGFIHSFATKIRCSNYYFTGWVDSKASCHFLSTFPPEHSSVSRNSKNKKVPITKEWVVSTYLINMEAITMRCDKWHLRIFYPFLHNNIATIIIL